MGQTRVVSTASNLSTKSTGFAFNVESLDEASPLDDDLNYVYRCALRIILLEYINEPRFRRKWRKVYPQQPDDKIEGRANHVQNKAHPRRPNKDNRLSVWFSHDDDNEGVEEENEERNMDAMESILSLLENQLSTIAMNQMMVKDALLRRSLLKFYNDVFLDPSFRQTVKLMSKPEDILMLFIKSANGELTKMEIRDSKPQLFNQVNYFINLLIQLSKDTPVGRTYEAKLNEYRNSFKETTNELGRTSSPSQKLVDIDDTLQPSFRFSEITHIKILCKLFSIDELQIQRDIVAECSAVKNDLYISELARAKQSLLNDTSNLTSNDFFQPDQYELWKTYQLHHIDDLQTRIAGNNGRNNQSGTDTNKKTYGLIPSDARKALTTLLYLVLRNDFDQDADSKISHDSKFLLSKCSKYWLLDYTSVSFNIFVSGALHCIERNTSSTFAENMLLLQYVFSYIETRVLRNEHDLDTTLWNERDQDHWVSNLITIFLWLIKEMKQSLKKLFEENKPKFKSIISMYKTLIEQDRLLNEMDFFKSDIYKRGIHTLKKQTFQSVEERYIVLVKRVPTNKDIKMHHVMKLSDQIQLDIEMVEAKCKHMLQLSTRFKLMEIVVNTFMTAIFNDLKFLLKRVEQYQEPKPQPIDGITTYQSLQRIRDFHHELTGANDSLLENWFAPYLYGFCSETCTKISDAVDECYARETWEPMNPNEGKLYSISVYDISKLITESMKLFFSLNWSNKPEICHVYTIILKSFSDSLIRYTSRMEELVMEDLEDTSSGKDKGSSQLDKKDGWLFTEMKNALNSPNLWNKTSKTLQTLQRVRRDLREKNRPGFRGASTGHGTSPELDAEAATVKPTFRKRTCVCLNNMEAMLQVLADLESRFHTDEIAKTCTEAGRARDPASDSKPKQLYTIKLVAAEGLGGSINMDMDMDIDTDTNKDIDTNLNMDMNSSMDVDLDADVNQDMDTQASMSSSTSTATTSMSAGTAAGTGSHNLAAVPIQTSRRPVGFGMSFVDAGLKHEIHRTKVVYGNIGYTWKWEDTDEEEFELELERGQKMTVNIMVWKYDTSGVSVYGKCYLDLSSSRYTDDGLPAEVHLDLDTRGKVFLQVSLEVEKMDANFIMGRCHRTVTRALDKCVSKMVQKFVPLIDDAFSRDTLYTVAAATQSTLDGSSSSSSSIYDSLIPLFDYLNGNLTVLAQELSTHLLHKLMLQLWNHLMLRVDYLLLPPLPTVRAIAAQGPVGPAHKKKGISVWDYAINSINAKRGRHGAGRRRCLLLTQAEMETVFTWIELLCKDFFHNGGEGPSLEDLKNDRYQKLLLIASDYDKSNEQLMQEFLDDQQHRMAVLVSTDRALQRRRTIMAHSTVRRRREAAAQLRALRLDAAAVRLAHQDTILRVLWSRGLAPFVMEQLQARDVRARLQIASHVAGSR